MKEQLPARVLAELYSNSLVYTGEIIAETLYDAPAPVKVQEEPAAIKPGIENKENVAVKPEPIKVKEEQVITKQLPVEEKQVKPVLKPIEEKVNKPRKWYLGNYEKKFIVLVNDAHSVHLNDPELEFLAGILSACKMNLAHIALINFKNNAVSFQQLKKELQPQFLVAFGINALQIELPFSMPDYQVQQYDNCSILTAPPLTQLNQQTAAAKTEKGKLWNCLKKMLDL